MNIVISVIGILGTISSIYFAFVAYKRTGIKEKETLVEQTTIFHSDIKHIKKSIEKMDKSLSELEKKYEDIKERLIKVEIKKGG